MTVKYLKLFWYQIFVHENLKLLDFPSDVVLISCFCRKVVRKRFNLKIIQGNADKLTILSHS